MKRLTSLLFVFLATMFAYAQTVPVANIVSGQKYNIKHVATGFYLNHLPNGDGDYNINTLLPGEVAFEFDFTAVATLENTYHVRADGKFIGGNSWKISAYDEATETDATRIILLPNEDGSLQLRAAWSAGNVINVDATAAGSRIYANKGENANSVWALEIAAAAPTTVELQSTSPADGATNVVASAPLVLTFNKSITLASTAGITIGDATGIGATASAYNLTITHDPLEFNKTYTVTIPAGTVAGYDQAITFSFTTIKAPILPVSGKRYSIAHSSGLYLTVVAANNRVELADKLDGEDSTQVFTFIDDGTGEGNFNIATSQGFLYNNGGWNANFKEALTGEDNEKIKTLINDSYTTIQALSRNATQYLGRNNPNEAVVYFDKGLDTGLWQLTELAPPSNIEFLSTTPANNATNIKRDANVAAIFNTNIVAGSAINGVTINGVAAAASVNGTSLVIAHELFAYATQYNVVVPAGAVAGYNEAINWSFTTETIPAFASSSPADAAVDIAIDAPVSITFDKAVTAIDLTGITIGDATGIVPAINGAVLTIAHDAFANNKVYAVTVPAGTIEGIATAITFSFTTVSALPEVASTSPDNNAVNVALAAPVTVTFNKDIVAADLTGITINGTTVVDAAINGKVLTIPHEAFAYETLQTVVIPAGAIVDYNEAITFSFTTKAQPVLPTAGKNYNIKNVGTNLYLSHLADTWNVSRINDPSGDADQVWALIATSESDVFNISYDGQYLTKNPNNGWDNVLTSDLTADAAKFVLTEAGDGITIQLLANRGTALYYAPQAGGAGSSVYLNSGAVNNWELWQFEEVVESDVLEVKTLTPLADAEKVSTTASISVLFTKAIVAGDLSGITIKDAEGVAVNGIAGSISGTRLIIAHDAFAFGKTYTVTVPVGAIADYTQVITWSFTIANPTFPQEPRAYTIKNATTGFYLTAPADVPADDSVINQTGKIGEEGEDADPTQIFQFTNADASNPAIFNIAVGGKFLNKVAGSAWASSLTETADDNSKFEITAEGSGIKIRAIANAAIYLAPNNAALGTAAYFDKTALITWELEEVSLPLALYKTTPANGATGIALDSEISATFNQSVTIGDLSGVTVKDADGVAVAGVAATLNEYVLNIAHAELAFSTVYTVTIPATAIDGLTENIVWSFTTKAAPSVTETTPEAGVTNAAIDVKVNVIYSENVTAIGDLTNVTIKTGGVAVEGVTTALLENTLAITHAYTFDYSTEYTVTVPANTIKGITTGFSYSFTTTAAPVLKSTTPKDAATEVELTPTVRATFDKKIFIDDATGITFKDASGASVLNKATASGSSLNITYTELKENTVYTVIIPANAIKGITTETKFSFTTIKGTGIDDVNAAQTAVYPTVSKGQVTVSTPGKATINVVDITGTKQATYQSTGEQTININTNGVYIIVVDSEGNISKHKVIVKK